MKAKMLYIIHIVKYYAKQEQPQAPCINMYAIPSYITPPLKRYDLQTNDIHNVADKLPDLINQYPVNFIFLRRFLKDIYRQ